MKKWLLLIVSLAFSYFSFAQCGNEEIKDTLIKNDALVQKQYPFAQNIQWKTCHGIDIYYAIFTEKDTSYSVVYNHKNEWLATEKRIYQDIFDYDYDTEKVSNNKIPFASARIFPTSLHPIIKKHKDFSINIKKYLKAKSIEDMDAIMDCYTITLNNEHELVKQYKTTTFYVVNLDGLALTFTKEKNIISDFYNFYFE